MVSISRPLAVALLVGTALLGVGAALHPMLPADVPGQLRMIAATSYVPRRASGDAVRLGADHRRRLDAAAHRASRVTPTPLIGALVLVCLGLCFNAIDIAFMGGAGWHLATAYVAGQQRARAAVRGAAPVRAAHGAVRQLPRRARRAGARVRGARGSGESALDGVAGVDRGGGRTGRRAARAGGEPADAHRGDADLGVERGDGGVGMVRGCGDAGMRGCGTTRPRKASASRGRVISHSGTVAF